MRLFSRRSCVLAILVPVVSCIIGAIIASFNQPPAPVCTFIFAGPKQKPLIRGMKLLPCDLPDWAQLPHLPLPQTAKMAAFPLLLVRQITRRYLEMKDQIPHFAREINPVVVSTVPTYANWTINGWNAHIHGNVFKRRFLDTSQQNRLLKRIMVRSVPDSTTTDWTDFLAAFDFLRPRDYVLTPDERSHALQTVNDIAVTNIDGSVMGGTWLGCNFSFILPVKTNKFGVFDGYIPLPLNSICSWKSPEISTSKIIEIAEFCGMDYKKLGVAEADSTDFILTKDIVTQPFSMGACTTIAPPDRYTYNQSDIFFVPRKGITIVCDIDDVLRETRVWNWKEMTLNILARPYKPWLNMPAVLWDLKERLEAEGQNVHFHYMTDAFDFLSHNYINGTNAFYPPGSWDFRPVNHTDLRPMLHSRHWNTQRLLDSFPDRRFIFLGDTTGASMLQWPKFLSHHSHQIKCFLMRDTQSTEPSDWMAPSLGRFQKMSSSGYWFFRKPDDLRLLSAKHLADPDAIGCNDVPLNSSIDVTKASRFSSLSFLRGFAWFVKCSFMSTRPNPSCPFDRLPGTIYHDGSREPEEQE